MSFLLGSYVLGIGYCGSLISMLTINVFPPAMNTMKDLSRKIAADVRNVQYSEGSFDMIFYKKLISFSNPLAPALAATA